MNSGPLVTGGSGVDPNYKAGALDNSIPRAYPFTWWEIPFGVIGLLTIIFAAVWHVPGLVILGILIAGVFGFRMAPRSFIGFILAVADVLLTIIVVIIAIVVLYQTRV